MIEHTVSTCATGLRPEIQINPGYLLEPFGWAAHHVGAMISSEPQLLPYILQIDRARMHLIALTLAHLDAHSAPQLARLLVQGSTTRETLQFGLGRSPIGIQRILKRLPPTVLTREGYKQLMQMLDQPQTAKLLHHVSANEITDGMIRILLEIPASLHAIVLAIGVPVQCLGTLAAGLRLLVSRGATSTFDELVADLGSLQHPGQFIARLRDLVDSLPLPQTLPPERIGLGRRLDSTQEVRTLARQWKNCLANRIERIDDGQCAVYLWEDQTSPAVCEVARYGRLGWLFTDALGPQNRDLDSEQLNQILSAFATCGMPEFFAVGAIISILQDHPRRTPVERVRAT
jgi:hypothetical protein